MPAVTVDDEDVFADYEEFAGEEAEKTVATAEAEKSAAAEDEHLVDETEDIKLREEDASLFEEEAVKGEAARSQEAAEEEA